MMPILHNSIPKRAPKTSYEQEQLLFAEMKREADNMRRDAARGAGQRLGRRLAKRFRRLPILVTWLKTRGNAPF